VSGLLLCAGATLASEALSRALAGERRLPVALLSPAG
jgi:hypothetical protein